jgi:hypothetical protein
MRFKYSTTNSTQNEFDSLPIIPLVLSRENHTLEANGLVDSGATVNVMPYEIGLQLGGIWDESKAIIQLAGNLSNQPAIPFFAMAEIGNFLSVQLVFAWVSSLNAALILGQTNFFWNSMFVFTVPN